jgi:peptidoglycan/LPS O-acetylase OafA/YrhL
MARLALTSNLQMFAVPAFVTGRSVAANKLGARAEPRVLALDGLRGVLALMVVTSHFFGEVPNGAKFALVGWIAVKMFFVLSGYLMARVIMEHMASPTFFSTFYIRRACRTLPVYFVLLAIVFGSVALFSGRDWLNPDELFPLWRYLTFTQSFEMVARGDYGLDWLTPTWTLTVEEQFYLVAPVLCLLAGQRHMMACLIAAAVGSIAFRFLAYGAGLLPVLSAQVLLPAVAHSMFFGMIAARLLNSGNIDWPRYDTWLRVVPIAVLTAVMLMKLYDGDSGTLFQLAGVPLASFGCVCYLISIVRGAPEARRLQGASLCILGRLSFGIYLLHMPVLGLMHGLVLDGKPDIATGEQLTVTLLAIPMTLALAWIINVWIEQPMIAFGKQWTFERCA